MGIKKCPNCAEEIKSEAKVCIHCGREVSKPFFTNGMINLIIFAIAILIAGLMFGNVEQKSFGPDKVEQKSFGNK